MLRTSSLSAFVCRHKPLFDSGFCFSSKWNSIETITESDVRRNFIALVTFFDKREYFHRKYFDFLKCPGAKWINVFCGFNFNFPPEKLLLHISLASPPAKMLHSDGKFIALHWRASSAKVPAGKSNPFAPEAVMRSAVEKEFNKRNPQQGGLHEISLKSLGCSRERFFIRIGLPTAQGLVDAITVKGSWCHWRRWFCGFVDNDASIVFWNCLLSGSRDYSLNWILILFNVAEASLTAVIHSLLSDNLKRLQSYSIRKLWSKDLLSSKLFRILTPDWRQSISWPRSRCKMESKRLMFTFESLFLILLSKQTYPGLSFSATIFLSTLCRLMQLNIAEEQLQDTAAGYICEHYLFKSWKQIVCRMM